MQDEIRQLQKDLKSERKRNDSLQEKIAAGGAPSSGSSFGQSGSKNTEYVKKRSFDQLVKEVDQCFAELGRQVQLWFKIWKNRNNLILIVSIFEPFEARG